MQRAYKAYTPVYSLMFICGKSCVKKMIIIILLNIDVSVLWELV